MGVAAHDEVRPRLGEEGGKVGLGLFQLGAVLGAPVDVDHQIVALAAGLLDDLHRQFRVIAAQHAGAVLPCLGGEDVLFRPGAGHIADGQPVHREVAGRHGLFQVCARTNIGDARVRKGGQGVGKGVGAVVKAVVVGKADDVHPQLLP